MWHLSHQLSKLLKKTSPEIKIPPILHRIPLITPPEILVIDFERLVWRVDGDNIPPCGITLAFVEFAFISKREPALLTTIWTERWSWNLVFLSVENWRDFLVKFEILVRNRKGNRTMTTGFGFDESFVFGDWVHKKE